MEQGVKRNDYIRLSVLCAILFELFLGLWALYNAMEAKEEFKRSNFDKGEEKAENAKKLCLFCVIAGLIKWMSVALFLFISVIL